MGKYDNWRRGEEEALLNLIGGIEIARGAFRGEYRITVVRVDQPKPAPKPTLVGRVAKTIIIPAYSAAGFAEAVRLGNFDNARDLGDIIRLWGNEPVGLDKPVKIDLVEFNREWWNDEALAWGTENNKRPMETSHTIGIAAGLPEEQRARPIVQVGSVSHGRVLCLSGNSGYRYLSRGTVGSGWNRLYLVGFVSESAA